MSGKAVCARHGQAYEATSCCKWCDDVIVPLADTLPRVEATPVDLSALLLDWPFEGFDGTGYLQ